MWDLELFHLLCKSAANETDPIILMQIRERMTELLLGAHLEVCRVTKPRSKPS
jgi:hypothetical protein